MDARARRHARLRQAWLHRGWLACLLWPLSLIYRALVAWHQALYRWGWRKPARLPVPVLVVGNVVAGGAGKTPVVMALAEHARRHGWQVGIISRGWGRANAQVQAVRPECTAEEVGDEPLLLARRTGVPVWVGAKRADTARALLAQHPEVDLILSDDGLQHAALARDVELCLQDERGLGNGWLLPAGPLREPWPRRHTAKVASIDVGSQDVQRHLAAHAVRADGTTRALRDFVDAPVHALAAIAKPEVFFEALREQGLSLSQCLALPDHDPLQALPWDPTQVTVLCTEKDAVKLWPRHPNVWAVPLTLQISPSLLARIDAALAQSRAALAAARSV